MVSWIRDFSNTYQSRTGRYPVIYTTTDWWRTCTGNSAAFGSTNPLWIARYASSVGTLPAGWSLVPFPFSIHFLSLIGGTTLVSTHSGNTPTTLHQTLVTQMFGMVTWLDLGGTSSSKPIVRLDLICSSHMKDGKRVIIRVQRDAALSMRI